MDISAIPIGGNPPNNVNVIIEVPVGTTILEAMRARGHDGEFTVSAESPRHDKPPRHGRLFSCSGGSAP